MVPCRSAKQRYCREHGKHDTVSALFCYISVLALLMLALAQCIVHPHRAASIAVDRIVSIFVCI